MKKWFFLALPLLLMAACNKNSDNAGNDPDNNPPQEKSTLVGTWELIRQEGYESIDGNRHNEWSEKSADFDATYLFNEDNTGKYTYFEHFNGEEYSSTEPVEWEYTETGKTLAVTFPKADGDRKSYTVEELSESQLVLVQHTIQPEYSYEYYNRETYVRK